MLFVEVSTMDSNVLIKEQDMEFFLEEYQWNVEMKTFVLTNMCFSCDVKY